MVEWVLDPVQFCLFNDATTARGPMKYSEAKLGRIFILRLEDCDVLHERGIDRYPGGPSS